MTAESQPFARVELAVLRALSGPYLRRARRVSAALEGAPPGTAINKNSRQLGHDIRNEVDSDLGART
ncbi:hypothetical protein GCM10011578_096870 [Streptomyces fuscichromogenes]|uniref:Uncharacterized protein n=1 Tax=Streptomyces fuscichromogenes TaxID=1324013 RepID=A0A918CXE5_9ACTN|nr:hypothetical protein GCM10011578_096870 [Streptomyces fuscichromogenes]